MLEYLERALSPIHRRVMLSIGRAVLSAVYDEAPTQRVQASLLKGETRDGVERMMQYGFTSVPHPGAQAIAVFPGGDRSQGIVIAVGDTRYRLKALADGEVAIHDDLEQKVHLTRTGIIVSSPNLGVRIEAKDIVMHGSHSWSWDVNGFGERWTSLGGTAWEHRTWQQGATVTTVTLPIDPPEGP